MFSTLKSAEILPPN